MNVSLLWVLLCWLSCLTPLQAQSLQQPLQLEPRLQALGQSVEVDWQAGVLRARGAGRLEPAASMAQAELLAMGSARNDALRLLALAAATLPAGRGQLRDYFHDEDFQALLLQGALLSEERQQGRLADGSEVIYVEAQLPLATLAARLLPFVQQAHDFVGQSGCADASFAPQGYTGLIVDARDSGLTPSLWLSLHDSSGQLLSQALFQARASTSAQTLVYHASLEAAHNDRAQVGTQPLVLQGRRGSGNQLILNDSTLYEASWWHTLTLVVVVEP